MNGRACHTAIIGAGPYGLSAAEHLRTAGMETRVFGQPMEFWARQMPEGMRLRSSWSASHISDRHRRWTLDRFQLERDKSLQRPIPLADFLEYTQWFQRQAVPDVDRRKVSSLHTNSDGEFRLVLEDGEVVSARHMVVATGIARFACRPPEFQGIPRHLASHSSEHRDLSRFHQRRVIVVGGGQSAVETAALLSEHGAQVELILRAPEIRWLTRSSRLHHLPKPLGRLFYHPTDVGPALVSHLVARPNLFKLLPMSSQSSLAYRSIRPAASDWLRPRVSAVRFTAGRRISAAHCAGDRVKLRLSDDSIRDVDHVILATGYRVDIGRCPFLNPELLAKIERVNGYPRLMRGLQCSIRGLHFLGAPAAYSFGPLMRFVSGTEFASKSLTSCLMGK